MLRPLFRLIIASVFLSRIGMDAVLHWKLLRGRAFSFSCSTDPNCSNLRWFHTKLDGEIVLSMNTSLFSIYVDRRALWLSILFILASQTIFMESSFSDSPDGFKDLVLHLKFDDGAPSSTAVDSSDYHLDGQLLNMDDLDWQAGVAGTALSFDGVNDYVEVADNKALDFGAGNFSVSFWFYKLATASNWSNTYGVNKWKSGAARGTNEWTLSIGGQTNKDTPSFVVEIGSTAYGLGHTSEVTLLEWHHVVGVRKNNTMSLYIDGALSGRIETLPVDGAVNNVGNSLRVAVNQYTPFLPYSNAIFDDIQIYNFALGDGGVAVGEPANDGIKFLFENPGVTITIFDDSFE